jgi:hypothetical protein
MTAVERVAEPVTVVRSQGRILNPCCGIIGEAATMRIEVSPAEFPDSEIRWSVVSGSGAFPGGNTGREVSFVAGGEDGDIIKLQVDCGDCPGNTPQFTLRAAATHEVKIYPCVIQKEDEDFSMTAARLNAMLDEVNVIFRQVGMHFSLGAGIMNVTNDVWAEYGLTRAGVKAQIRNIMTGTDGLEIYFVPGLENKMDVDDVEALGRYNQYGIIVKDSAEAMVLAHEIGHACHWGDIYSQTPENYPFELSAATKEMWLANDWNNGTGVRFYPMLTSQRDVISRLLMNGYHSGEPRTDIPLGNVHGQVRSGELGLVNVGRLGLMTTSPYSL